MAKTSRTYSTKALVGAHEKWRLTLMEAAALCGIGRTVLHELLRKGEFPPRVHTGSELAGKEQFIAREVRAWAEGGDWRAMVAERVQGVANAS